MKLGAQQITRVRAALVSDGRHGGHARDWESAASLVIDGVSVQPFATAETPVDAAYIADRLRVFVPAGTDLLPTDRVVFEATTYEVDGGAQRWTDLSGRPDHVEVVIKRLAG